MNIILDGFLLLRITYYRWALKSMGPTHKDFPLVFQHVDALTEQLNSNWSGGGRV
jgi:hypothetical protein